MDSQTPRAHRRFRPSRTRTGRAAAWLLACLVCPGAAQAQPDSPQDEAAAAAALAGSPGGLVRLAGRDPAQVPEQAESGSAEVAPDRPPPAGKPSLLDLPLEQLAQQPVREAAGTGPIVESASRREERASQAPGMIIVLDQRDIKLRGYAQLTDVLRDLPGMETIPYYFSEFGTQVPVRGISGNNKIVVLVNGTRVSPPGGENFPFRSDFSVRFAERVEVVYGAGSTLYGQDAISMIVNVVTKKHVDGPSESRGADGERLTAQTPPGTASAGGTTDNLELGAYAGLHSERELWGWYGGFLDCCHNIEVTAYAQYHDSQLTPFDRAYPNYWQAYKDVAVTKTNANGGGVVPDRDDYGLNVFARLEGFGSSLQVWHRESERSSAEGYSYPTTPTAGLGFLPEARWADSSTAVEAKNTWQLCGGVALESMTTYLDYVIDPISRYVFPDSPTSWFLDDFKYGRGWRVGQEETLHLQLTDRLSVLAGGVIYHSDIIPKATIQGGYDASRDPVEQGRDFVYTDASGVHTIPAVSDVRFWTYAAYVESQWQMFDRVRLIGGVRVTKDDHYEQIPITPRAAVICNATDQITAKYMYTQAFVAPAPYFAYATYDNGTLLATTNPNVAPETAETHELNLTYQDESLILGVSPYLGTQSSIITVSDRAAPQNILEYPVFLNGNLNQPRTLVQTANGGESRRFGTDLYGKVTRDCLRSWFSYSYVDFQATNAGLTTGLPGISKHNGRLGVTWQAEPNLFITPSLVIRSTPENVNPDVLGPELDTPWEINLYLLYKYTPHMDVFADFRNLTDHHYALGGFSGDAIPQETLRGMVGLRLTY